MNVNRLVFAPIGKAAGGLAKEAKAGDVYETGDVLVIWRDRGNANDAHVLVVESFDGAELRSWDYGQGPMRKDQFTPDSVEGRKRVRKVIGHTPTGKPILEGGRAVQSWLSLAEVVRSLEAVA